ncbi:TPA: hypothetical protein ACGIK9_003367 [Acinetobacter baumannii]|uniref:hypothetical protein n=1 Tax=Acinetobacter baumannii TaxID=470 RepID=UPI00338DBA5D
MLDSYLGEDASKIVHSAIQTQDPNLYYEPIEYSIMKSFYERSARIKASMIGVLGILMFLAGLLNREALMNTGAMWCFCLAFGSYVFLRSLRLKVVKKEIVKELLIDTVDHPKLFNTLKRAMALNGNLYAFDVMILVKKLKDEVKHREKEFQNSMDNWSRDELKVELSKHKDELSKLFTFLLVLHLIQRFSVDREFMDIFRIYMPHSWESYTRREPK